MSDFIENLSRSGVSKLTGNDDTTSTQTASAQNERGARLVKSLATGGLALGTGVSAAVALVNYLKTLQEENELEDEARLNDDTLYIAPRQKKASEDKPAQVNRWVAPGLAVTGGILATAGSYALTQAVYNYLQKKRKEKQLDEAQGEALRAADTEAEKYASEAKMNLYDLISSVPVALPLLAALATGGVTYAALRKTFPTVTSPKSKYPKRVRQVAADGSVSEAELPEEETLKSAADMAAENDIADAGQEFMMLIVDQMNTEKAAAHSFTSELLCKVAKDGINPVTRTQRDGGMEALLEFIKGASDSSVGLPERVLAATAICKSARLKPVASAWAAAEFLEHAPGLSAEVLSYGEEQLEKFAGIAPLLHLAYFRPHMLEKSAMSSPGAEQLKQLLMSLQAGGLEKHEASDDTLAQLTSDAAGGTSEEAEGTVADLSDEDLQPTDTDPVDMFLQTKKDESPLLAQPSADEVADNIN